MFSNLAIVREVVSKTELKVYNIVSHKEVIVKASKEYVGSIKAELNDDDSGTFIIEYDLETMIVNENIEE